MAPYRQWHKSLPNDVEVLAAQLPGRESKLRESPLRSVAAMVGALLPTVAAATDLPYAIFGHSMGAVLAFELTVALEATSGCPSPTHLFVSAHRAPYQPDPETPMHALPDVEFLDEMERRYGAIPAEVRNEPELLQLLLPTVRADLEAIETYKMGSGARVKCPVRVYGGESDQHPTVAELAEWRNVADAPVTVVPMPGGHFYLNEHAPLLIADLTSAWSAASPASVLS